MSSKNHQIIRTNNFNQKFLICYKIRKEIGKMQKSVLKDKMANIGHNRINKTLLISDEKNSSNALKLT